MKISEDKMELVFREIEDQFSIRRKVKIPILRDGLFASASVSYDVVSKIISFLKVSHLLIENSDNTFSLHSKYKSLKEGLLSSLE